MHMLLVVSGATQRSGSDAVIIEIKINPEWLASGAICDWSKVGQSRDHLNKLQWFETETGV